MSCPDPLTPDTQEALRRLIADLGEPRLGIHEDGTEELKTWEQLWDQCQQAAAALASMQTSEKSACQECATARAAANSWKDELMRLKVDRSAIAPTVNDKRWRFLEHGCEWVAWRQRGSETAVTFDPTHVPTLQDMRATIDRQAEEQIALLRAGADRLKP